MTHAIAQIFWIVLPVFGLIGLGYLASRTGYLSEQIGEGLGDFVFKVAIPLLLFKTLATAEFAGHSPWLLWLSYYSGLGVTWALAYLLIRRVFGRDEKAGIIAGISASYPNAVLLGLPLVFTALGEEGGVPLLMIVAIQLPLMMTASTVLIAWAEQRDGTATQALSAAALARHVVVNLARNPLVIGIVAGSAWRALELPYAGPLEILGDRIAIVALPCALFALGMSLTKYGIRGHILPAVVITVVKLVVMPAIVWVLSALVFGLPPLVVVVATLVAACPTGVNAWLIANRFRTGLAISANSITLTDAASVLTLSIWLWLLGF
ncbi:AEC family transporter [Microbaculum marinum]|uniref:AEC family transporter n=1 Tax=Microbaculum marinum TaxID=1764581 RepID=A0AAW9RAG2_9HYPH